MRRLDNIDLRLLRVFATLAEAGSFADTQMALNLSQSTLSTHLASLEKKLGSSLCVRGRRGFQLTPFGEATYEAAKRLFADIDSFQQKLSRKSGQLIGRLRIGTVDGVVTNPEFGLHEVIRRFSERAADVFIDLELGAPVELERSIADGGRDIAIGPFSQKAPGITYFPLYREPHALYCGCDHPLFAEPTAKIDKTAIERSRFSVRGYRQLEDLYRVEHPRASARVLHMEAQVMLILSGKFIGFLPRHIGDSWADRGLMRVLKPKIYQFSSSHLAAIRRKDGERPIVREFLRELRRKSTSAH